ncbi:hypothetical protein PTKIN_Ptkin04bG0034600 [Pterospermum kingtungense]
MWMLSLAYHFVLLQLLINVFGTLVRMESTLLIRYAYRLAMELLATDSHFHVPGEWQCLWQLQVQPKVKNFVWRTAREILLNRETLRSRGVDVPSTCIFVLAVDMVNNLASNADTFIHWLFVVVQTLQDQVASKELECLYEWLQAKAQPARVSLTPVGCIPWHPPPPSFRKCNCDVAIFSDMVEIGIGIVLRDVFGDLLAYKMLRFLGILTVREGEALALFEAIVWMRELGHTRVLFESDSQLVVAFVKRHANRAGHTLPRQSYFMQNPTVGFASPNFLIDALRPICLSIDH